MKQQFYYPFQFLPFTKISFDLRKQVEKIAIKVHDLRLSSHKLKKIVYLIFALRREALLFTFSKNGLLKRKTKYYFFQFNDTSRSRQIKCNEKKYVYVYI